MRLCLFHGRSLSIEEKEKEERTPFTHHHHHHQKPSCPVREYSKTSQVLSLSSSSSSMNNTPQAGVSLSHQFTYLHPSQPKHNANVQSTNSTPIPLAVNVVIVLFLVNPLLVHAPRRRGRGSRDRRRRQHFRQALELFALPLDFADAFAALAADVLG